MQIVDKRSPQVQHTFWQAAVLEQWPVPLYMVGGAVRDTLLGQTPKDVDICSSLLPDQVVSYCRLNHQVHQGVPLEVKCEVTNPSHLVVTIWVDGVPIEHTTFRKEGLYDGVHASLVEPSTITEDAFRRDLTINGLYMLWGTGEVIDLVGGLSDLHSKTLRLISSKEYGNEYQRLWEHGGRLFRLARFASTKFKDWAIDPGTMDACREFIPYVFQRGKCESFGEEWAKAGYCWEYLQVLDTMGFLNHYIGDIWATKGFNGCTLPPLYEWYPDYPWYSLWVYSGKPPLYEYQGKWKLPNTTILEIQDLMLGKFIECEWQWRTIKFRRLSAYTVATFWGKSFRVLNIPTQGDVAAEIGAGPQASMEGESKGYIRGNW